MSIYPKTPNMGIQFRALLICRNYYKIYHRNLTNEIGSMPFDRIMDEISAYGFLGHSEHQGTHVGISILH